MTALPIQFDANDSSWTLKSKSIPYIFSHLLFHNQFPHVDNMSNLPSVQIQLQGVSPLLCHNGQTADPRNTYAKAMKAVSGKQKKTDADYDEMARLEWLAGLYRIDGDLVIPDRVIESAMIKGAMKSKRGPQAKCGLFFTEHSSLEFDGKPAAITDDTLSEMFESGQFTHTIGVKVGMNKVMRTRPIFRNWNLKAFVQYDPDVIDRRDIEEIAYDAGRLVGIGDWRPKHGRFNVFVTSAAERINDQSAEVA